MSVLDSTKDSPLYEQLMVKIKEDIFASKSRAGGQLLSQKAMAQKYNVSLITVKRALRELAVQGIIVGHARRGTYVARKKTAFAIPEQNVIGLVLIDPPDSQIGMLLRGAEDYAVKKGYRLLIAPALIDQGMESEQIDFFHSIGVAGILAGSVRRDYTIPESLAQLHKVGFPYVLLSYAADPHIKQVCVDDEDAGYVAADHLIKTGRHTIGFMGAGLGSPTGELKKKGYVRALRKHRLIPSPEFEFHVKHGGEEQEYAAGYKIGEQCIRTPKIPDGLSRRCWTTTF
ncbi:MAG: GntR family transcriptional regulator [Ignavibacteriales bacterium]|nr:GntR family transcriptional regulator [Ignavibacteriales bacterium]